MNGEEAVYRRIAAGLREQITAGHLPPRAPVPGEVALGRQEGVSRITARNALRLLEQEGLITGGRVKTVADHRRIRVPLMRTGAGWAGESRTLGADSWAVAVQAEGREPSQRIDVLAQLADLEPATRLRLAPWAQVTVRRLIRYADGEPHNMITFWFPRDVTNGTPLAGPESIAEGSVAWLERELGPLSHWTPEISARMPAPDEAEILRIPGGQPVQEVWRGSCAGGRPVVVSRAVYPADRTTLTVE